MIAAICITAAIGVALAAIAWCNGYESGERSMMEQFNYERMIKRDVSLFPTTGRRCVRVAEECDDCGQCVDRGGKR